jgi:hypothetical protein
MTGSASLSVQGIGSYADQTAETAVQSLSHPLISDNRENAAERGACRDGFAEACHERG